LPDYLQYGALGMLSAVLYGLFVLLRAGLRGAGEAAKGVVTSLTAEVKELRITLQGAAVESARQHSATLAHVEGVAKETRHHVGNRLQIAQANLEQHVTDTAEDTVRRIRCPSGSMPATKPPKT